MKIGRTPDHRATRLLLGTMVFGFLILLGSESPLASSMAETHLRIPVVPVNLKQGMAFSCTPPACIDVQVHGAAGSLETLSSLKPTYELDLSSMSIGYHTVPVQSDCVKLPRGISIVTLSPANLRFRLDEEIEKELPVKVICHGDPASGFIVAGTVASPPQVLIRGPKYLVDDLQTITTHPVDVRGATESFKKEVSLNLTECIQIVPQASPVTAQIHIEERIITKILNGIQVQGRYTSRAFQITPPQVTIQVKGPANELSKLESKHDFSIYINLKELQPGVFVRRAVIELPVEITLLHAEPRIFTVTIE